MVYDIYEMFATNSQQKAVRGKRVGVHEISSSSSVLASKVADMFRKLNLLLNKEFVVGEQCLFCSAIGH